MLPAVCFNYYPSFEADKICNEPADLLLAPELEPNGLPQMLIRFGAKGDVQDG